jgi:hypothetical protein
MQDIINIAVNNGLGICSFIALLYFIMNIDKQNNQNQKDLNETLKAINDSMIEIQIALVKLTERVSDLENKKEVD